jgi:succinoglycan biosynthesis protein ExoM
MHDTNHIDVLICTYQRASLDECLASVLAQDLPNNLTMSVIVADNSPTKWAQKTTVRHAKDARITVHYVHAPAGNISIARNACLDLAVGDYVVFIDDDEIAPRDWLANLWNDMAYNDVLFGPVIAGYPQNTPHWIVGNDFHSTTLDPDKEPITTGYAGNVMMRWHDAPWSFERFDIALGVTGGEDTDFFSRLYHLGAQLAFSPNSFVQEPVDERRLTMRWMASRRFRSGQSFADIAMLDMHRAKLFSTAFLKSMYSAFCIVANAFSPKRAGFWLMRCLFHMGVFTRSIQPRGKVAR